METTVTTLEQESTELRRELDYSSTESNSRLGDLNKQLSSLRAEKEDASRDLQEAQEKLKLQAKEIKDALGQKKLAMSEYTEVTDK